MKKLLTWVGFCGFFVSLTIFGAPATLLLSPDVKSLTLNANGLAKIPSDFVGALTINAVARIDVLQGVCTPPEGPQIFVTPGDAGTDSYSLGYQTPKCSSAAKEETVEFPASTYIVRASSELEGLKKLKLRVSGKLVSLSTLF